jgi:predicted dinucleotide-binding enzyme
MATWRPATASGAPGWPRPNTCPAPAWCGPSNAINAGPLARQAFEKPARLGIPLASDDPDAMKIAEQLVSDAGFDPVPVGGLARAREFDVGTPVYVRGMTAAELRKALNLK